jgi:hypothetical protein
MRLLSLAIATAALLAVSVAATAEDARPYDNGPVWDVSGVLTKPGHFDDYLKYVATTWRAQQEELKKAGLVLDYKVLTTQDARENEPDIWLMVEYKNMAALDTPLDQQDAIMKKVFGSLAAGNKGMADRDTIRILKGDMLARELILK